MSYRRELGRANALRKGGVLILALWQSVRNVVIIALIGDIDVVRQRNAGGAIGPISCG